VAAQLNITTKNESHNEEVLVSAIENHAIGVSLDNPTEAQEAAAVNPSK